MEPLEAKVEEIQEPERKLTFRRLSKHIAAALVASMGSEEDALSVVENEAAQEGLAVSDEQVLRRVKKLEKLYRQQRSRSPSPQGSVVTEAPGQRFNVMEHFKRLSELRVRSTES